MRDTCLSIDLDYFGGLDARYRCTQFIQIIINYCKEYNIDMSFVYNHQDILSIINSERYIRMHMPNNLINIDYHEDIGNGDWGFGDLIGLADNKNSECREGDWVQRVLWGKNGKYIWRYPSEYSLEFGLCHGRGLEPDPFVEPNYYNWKYAEKQLGLNGLDLDRINYVCFCISFDYWNVKKERVYNWKHRFVDTYQQILHRIMDCVDYETAFKKLVKFHFGNEITNKDLCCLASIPIEAIKQSGNLLY